MRSAVVDPFPGRDSCGFPGSDRRLRSDAERPVAGGNLPLVDGLAILDDRGAAMEGTGRTDVSREGQDRRAGGEPAGVRGLDDEVLLAMDAKRRLRDVDQGQACSRGIGRDRLVAEVEAEPAGPGLA